MITDIQQKYDQLTEVQKEIFAGYGLRQIKHFVEVSLPTIKALLPCGADVQGINSQGKLQAFNPETQQTYLWISDLKWQATPVTDKNLDTAENFIAIWQTFNLQAYPMIDLSHIHRDFLAGKMSETNF
ncbi:MULTISPECIES: hypothetical protein [unclassified Acinetobacter]|uniref:hypothetical protein n=1 Tax=unclassified Acinetobacter TaxID=196816 RepID=UPI002934F2F7|nr:MULTISPECIES: hypothetical protein [unclassified Acinetobacter]WOE31471.1 hypothetical protein QSG84_14355 [Acinetobacter sp. SAAs470]WOE39667.1 hypothetical protein QSG86_08020 [Acinetobacter sp. SAAs474]